MINFEEIEKELKQPDDELLIIFKKGSDMSSHITSMMNNQWMVGQVINRQIIVDTLGDYNMMYSMDTNIQKILDGLNREWNNPIQEMTMDEPQTEDSKGIGVGLQPNM